MPEDEPDAIGLGFPPPPVVYLRPLIIGLLLNRKIPVPFLPRRLTRIVGLPLFGGGVLLGDWTYRTTRRADTPIIGEPLLPGRPTSIATSERARTTRAPTMVHRALLGEHWQFLGQCLRL
jgi:hypothetical protein